MDQDTVSQNIINVMIIIIIMLVGYRMVTGKQLFVDIFDRVNSNKDKPVVPYGTNNLAPVNKSSKNMATSYNAVVKCVMYSRETCGFCKKQKDLLSEYKDGALLKDPRFKIVDCGKNEDECSAAGINGIPAFTVKPSGKEPYLLTGLRKPEVIEAMLDE
tara:strand:- start:10 stop:486 length:477 start_codon:yes stop_codon:yes gene_type:complete